MKTTSLIITIIGLTLVFFVGLKLGETNNLSQIISKDAIDSGDSRIDKNKNLGIGIMIVQQKIDSVDKNSIAESIGLKAGDNIPVVDTVLNNTPAEVVGLKQYDIIISVNSKSVINLDIQKVIELIQSSSEVSISILRPDGKIYDFDTYLIDMNQWLGENLSKSNDDSSKTYNIGGNTEDIEIENRRKQLCNLQWGSYIQDTTRYQTCLSDKQSEYMMKLQEYNACEFSKRINNSLLSMCMKPILPSFQCSKPITPYCNRF